MARHAAPTFTEREPAAVIAVVVAFATAVLGLLVAFGVDVTPEQRDAILGVIGPTVLLIGLVAALIRRKVSPTATTVATVTASGAILAGGASALPTGVRVSPRATVEGLLDVDAPDDELDGDDEFYDPATTSLPPHA